MKLSPRCMKEGIQMEKLFKLENIQGWKLYLLHYLFFFLVTSVLSIEVVDKEKSESRH